MEIPQPIHGFEGFLGFSVFFLLFLNFLWLPTDFQGIHIHSHLQCPRIYKKTEVTLTQRSVVSDIKSLVCFLSIFSIYFVYSIIEIHRIYEFSNHFASSCIHFMCYVIIIIYYHEDIITYIWSQFSNNNWQEADIMFYGIIHLKCWSQVKNDILKSVLSNKNTEARNCVVNEERSSLFGKFRQSEMMAMASLLLQQDRASLWFRLPPFWTKWEKLLKYLCRWR